MAGQFENKVALVTGAGSGIGRAAARMFVREGARVLVSDIDVKGGQKTVDLIEQKGGEAVFTRTDVSSASEVEAMVDLALSAFGRLDYAVNNAGIMMPATPFTEVSEETFNHVMAVNLTSVFLCMKFELIHMLKHGSGAIVNVASMAGLRGLSFRPAYAASKHGVVGITKAGALEFASSGIRINCVCPGVTNTAMAQKGGKAQMKKFMEKVGQIQPMGRMGEPEEIAEAIIWLCSDKASFVTGLIMDVSGGWTSQ